MMSWGASSPLTVAASPSSTSSPASGPTRSHSFPPAEGVGRSPLAETRVHGLSPSYERPTGEERPHHRSGERHRPPDGAEDGPGGGPARPLGHRPRRARRLPDRA